MRARPTSACHRADATAIRSKLRRADTTENVKRRAACAALPIHVAEWRSPREREKGRSDRQPGGNLRRSGPPPPVTEYASPTGQNARKRLWRRLSEFVASDGLFDGFPSRVKKWDSPSRGAISSRHCLNQNIPNIGFIHQSPRRQDRSCAEIRKRSR